MKRITLAIIGTIAIFSTSLADVRSQRDEFSNPPAFNKPKRIKKQ